MKRKLKFGAYTSNNVYNACVLCLSLILGGYSYLHRILYDNTSSSRN